MVNKTSSNGHDKAPALGINAQYIKDLSFENPGIMSNVEDSDSPKVNIDIRVHAEEIKTPTHNVSLNIKIKAQQKLTTLFILELSYVGIFTLKNVAKEMLDPILYIECPRLLFPFARSIIANVTADGGFPQLLLTPVNFHELYAKQQGMK